ncbi:MAG: DUF357 domain-containing protein [Nanoarchaeota archaeon]|nr:DUF357 domain-containing protein [Nanoarchaeota archaeon]
MENKDISRIVADQRKKLEEVFLKIRTISSDKKAEQILRTARDYFDDSKYFLDNEDYTDAFEAVIISWAFVDVGLLLGLFDVPDELKDYFI